MRDPAQRLRIRVLLLALATEVGVLLELAMLRHWKTGVQIIPWVVVGLLLVATVGALARPERASRGVRSVAYLAFPAAGFGLWEHVEANHNAGPLDFRYATRWKTMSAASQWWTAATKGVGPSPPLTPAVLALIALMLLLATVSATRRRDA